MDRQQGSLQPPNETMECGCHYKATPRGDMELRQLQKPSKTNDWAAQWNWKDARG